jgi:nicotinamide riboside kinase
MSLRIAILGAESTGKSTLALALAQALAAPSLSTPAVPSGAQPSSPAWRVAVVPETLREWCEREGRTPKADEQRSIMAEHHRRIEQAALHHDIVLCDTTALMTAIYSRTVFGDRSLEAEAMALHRSMAATLLTALDLPWVADGLQREGAHVREPVDRVLRELLLTHGIGFSVIHGSGASRTAQALAALAPVLRGAQDSASAPWATAVATTASEARSEPASALAGSQPAAKRQAGAFSFTQLLARQQPAAAPHHAPTAAGTAAWACACCSVPELERALARGAVPFQR